MGRLFAHMTFYSNPQLPPMRLLLTDICDFNSTYACQFLSIRTLQWVNGNTRRWHVTILQVWWHSKYTIHFVMLLMSLSYLPITSKPRYQTKTKRRKQSCWYHDHAEKYVVFFALSCDWLHFAFKIKILRCCCLLSWEKEMSKYKHCFFYLSCLIGVTVLSQETINNSFCIKSLAMNCDIFD